MDLCAAGMERHLVLNSDRFDTHPKARSAICDYVEQLDHKSGPMDVGEMAWSEGRDEEAEWEDVRVIGYARERARGRRKEKGRKARALGKAPERMGGGQLEVQLHEDLEPR